MSTNSTRKAKNANDIKVRDIMSSPAVTIHRDSTLFEAAKEMLSKRVGCLPVVDDEGRLVGIVSESDFIAQSHNIPFSRDQVPQLFGKWLEGEDISRIYDEARTMKVEEIMTKQVVSVAEGTPLQELIDKMIKYGFYRFPVVEEDTPVGIVSKRDFLKLLV